jgi:hypothetical protein
MRPSSSGTILVPQPYSVQLLLDTVALRGACSGHFLHKVYIGWRCIAYRISGRNSINNGNYEKEATGAQQWQQQ